MLKVTFEDMEQLKQVYDPIIVEKAASATIKQLHSKSATLVSRAVRDKYSIKARDIKTALKQRVAFKSGVPVGYLIYTSRRISLRHFSPGGRPTSRTRPRVKTARGVRRGAKIKVMKTRPARLIKGAFWGRGAIGSGDGITLGDGEWQVFQRMGLSRLKIRKLTGPSISHMVRGDAPLKAINDLVQKEGGEKFANNIDHFIQKKIGTR